MTEEDYREFVAVKLSTPPQEAPAIFWYVAGIAAEGGEALDQCKKFFWHGREFDRKKLLNELGDVLFYLTASIEELGSSFDEVRALNKVKLIERHGIGPASFPVLGDPTHGAA